ncbi:flagellar filament capping protein FliD [Paraburkholderia sp. ZP32-5]|uniref:flagellar filament capping protein FliD n=1 Tax=Paraburkholderia sp. ZP32-5 TaxID=2883245 RepID=UPI001F243A7B|nr:flagellar filament capping protein FliD [Paraburkholderia sp. ZP32-5]
MSTIPGTSNATSGSQSSAQAAAAAAQAALQAAAQSIIGGSTGNSLDVGSLVSALVTAKVAGQTQALATQTSTDNAQISALGQLQASLAQLQVNIAPLFNGSMLTAFTASVTGTAITASAGSGAVAGTYSLNVSQVASAQSLTSGAFSTSAAQSLGTGTLSVSVGGKSMDVDINASNNSLSGIAAAINSANDNPGVSATVVTGSDGSHLVLSSKSTGAANTINVSVSNASSGSTLGNLAVSTSTTVSSSSLSSTQASALGAGTMAVTVGSQTLNVSVGATDSLTDLANSINSAATAKGAGVTASVSTDASGNQTLVLTPASSSISVSATVSGATSGSPLAGLTMASQSQVSSSSGWVQASAAADAVFTINGTQATSSTNAVTTALPGVTINLTAAAVGSGTQTLTVAPDTATEATDISNFVTAYNAVMSTISSLTSYNKSAAAGSQGGPLLGNSMVQSLQLSLGNIVSSSVSSSGVSGALSSLGITLNQDGTLSLDPNALNSAVQTDPSQVAAVFNLTNGIGQQLNATVKNYTATSDEGGLISLQTDALTTDLKNITTQTTALTAYSNQLTTQYNAEFTALNTLMASTQNDTQYLTALFGGSNSSGALSDAKG